MITIKDISYSIGTKPILKNISLNVHSGDFLCVIGPNGAGKSTLIKLLCGLIKASGDVFINGKLVQSYSRKDLAKIIAYVPQMSPFEMHFTVDEYIMMGRYPYQSRFGGVSADDRRIVDDVIIRTGLTELRQRDISTLSGGERQRAVIAAALAQESSVLLLDEPTIYLDPKSALDVLNLLAKIHESGVTVVMVTHDINQSLSYGTSFAGLKKGSLIFATDEAGTMLAGLDKLFDMSFDVVEHAGRLQVLNRMDEGVL